MAFDLYYPSPGGGLLAAFGGIDNAARIRAASKNRQTELANARAAEQNRFNQAVLSAGLGRWIDQRYRKENLELQDQYQSARDAAEYDRLLKRDELLYGRQRERDSEITARQESRDDSLLGRQEARDDASYRRQMDVAAYNATGLDREGIRAYAARRGVPEDAAYRELVRARQESIYDPRQEARRDASGALIDRRHDLRMEELAAQGKLVGPDEYPLPDPTDPQFFNIAMSRLNPQGQSMLNSAMDKQRQIYAAQQEQTFPDEVFDSAHKQSYLEISRIMTDPTLRAKPPQTAKDAFREMSFFDEFGNTITFNPQTKKFEAQDGALTPKAMFDKFAEFRKPSDKYAGATSDEAWSAVVDFAERYKEFKFGPRPNPGGKIEAGSAEEARKILEMAESGDKNITKEEIVRSLKRLKGVSANGNNTQAPAENPGVPPVRPDSTPPTAPAATPAAQPPKPAMTKQEAQAELEVIVKRGQERDGLTEYEKRRVEALIGMGASVE